MYNTTFVSDRFTVNDNDYGTAVAPRGKGVEETLFFPNGDVRADRLYEDMEALKAVWTDFEHPDGPKLDHKGYDAAVDELLSGLF